MGKICPVEAELLPSGGLQVDITQVIGDEDQSSSRGFIPTGCLQAAIRRLA